MVKPEEIDLVIYHALCPDGFGAAWAAWRVLGDNAEYVPMSHGEEPPDVTGRVVGIFDFNFPRPVIEEMKAKAKDLILVDHHIGAERVLGDLEYCYFDMTHSGCVLTWQLFHSEDVPTLLRYVEDRDLWKFELEQTENYLAYIDTIGFDFLAWNEIYEHGVRHLERFSERGTHINRLKNIMVEDAMKKARLAVFDGHLMWVVNLSSRFLISKTCNLLAAKKYGVAMAWWYDHEKNETACSLRSIKESGIDVSKIAARFGGGGHKMSSGFVIAGLVTEKLLDPRYGSIPTDF